MITTARGALALSTLPLLTMVVGALLGAEAMTLRKSAGVLIAVLETFQRADGSVVIPEILRSYVGADVIAAGAPT